MSLEEAENLISNLPTDAPTWAEGLITAFKGLLVEFKLLNESVGKMVRMESMIAVQQNTTDLLHSENGRLNNRIMELEKLVDNNEQHDRNINLVLHGIKEEKGENTTSKFVEALSVHDINVSVDDIARSHRLGSYRQHAKKTRPVIARFKDETKKLLCIRGKKT